MKKNIKKPEVDEFWDDCTKDHLISNSKKIKSSNESKNKLYNNHKDDVKLKIAKITNNKKLIREALATEEKIPLERRRRERQSIQNCIKIYNKDLKSKELKKENNNKSRKLFNNIDFQECTFKPKKCINRSIDNKINRKFGNLKIYDRGVRFQQKRFERMTSLIRESSQLYNDEFDFHPLIEDKNIEKVLYQNSFWQEKADNDSNKLFLLRYMKAREKYMFLHPENRKENYRTFHLKYNDTYPKKMIRSISQKDSLVLKKYLHQNLLQLKDPDEEEDNNEINNEVVLEDAQ